MFLRYAGVYAFAFLGLLSLSVSYKLTPNVVDGIPRSLNIDTNPFVKIGNGYYYIESNIQKNWFDAYESCRRINADLVSFETIEEWDSVNLYLIQKNIYNLYWTGGNDLATQGKHNWFSTAEPMTLDIWYPGQPDNYKGNEHCDELGYRETRNSLNDGSCSKKNRYICEAPQPKTASFIVW